MSDLSQNNNKKEQEKSWVELVNDLASKWGHVILKITGKPPTRRSYVIWFCSKHPLEGTHVCQIDDSKLTELNKENTNQKTKGLSQEDIDNLIKLYPGQPFYSSRMDNYLNPNKKDKNRKYCCFAGMIIDRKEAGFELFQQLLIKRGKHYNTQYTLLIDVNSYKGKRIKHPFKCVAHNIVLNYSL